MSRIHIRRSLYFGLPFAGLLIIFVINALFWQPGEHPAPIPQYMAMVAIGQNDRNSADAYRPYASQSQNPAMADNPGSIDDILDSATRLERVQMLLADLGYGPLAVDGVLGEETGAAIRRFQNQHGLRPTGVIDAVFLRELEQFSGMPLQEKF